MKLQTIGHSEDLPNDTHPSPLQSIKYPLFQYSHAVDAYYYVYGKWIKSKSDYRVTKIPTDFMGKMYATLIID